MLQRLRSAVPHHPRRGFHRGQNCYARPHLGKRRNFSTSGRRTPRLAFARAINPSLKSEVNRRGNRIDGSESAAQPEFGWLKLQCAELAASRGLIPESRSSVQGERIAIEVIFQVEHTRKSGAGKIGFAPGAVCDPAAPPDTKRLVDRGIVGIGASQQYRSSPRRSAKRAAALAFGLRHVIGHQRFAEAAVRSSAREPANDGALTIFPAQ